MQAVGARILTLIRQGLNGLSNHTSGTLDGLTTKVLNDCLRFG